MSSPVAVVHMFYNDGLGESQWSFIIYSDTMMWDDLDWDQDWKNFITQKVSIKYV